MSNCLWISDERKIIAIPWRRESSNGKMENFFCKSDSIIAKFGIHQYHSHNIISVHLWSIYSLICICADGCRRYFNQFSHCHLKHWLSTRCLAADNCHNTKWKPSTSSGNRNTARCDAQDIFLGEEVISNLDQNSTLYRYAYYTSNQLNGILASSAFEDISSLEQREIYAG